MRLINFLLILVLGLTPALSAAECTADAIFTEGEADGDENWQVAEAFLVDVEGCGDACNGVITFKFKYYDLGGRLHTPEKRVRWQTNEDKNFKITLAWNQRDCGSRSQRCIGEGSDLISSTCTNGRPSLSGVIMK